MSTHLLTLTQARGVATDYDSPVIKSQLHDFTDLLFNPQFKRQHLRKHLLKSDMSWLNEYCMGMILTLLKKRNKIPDWTLLNFFEEKILFMKLSDPIACTNLLNLFSKADYNLSEEALLKLVDVIYTIKDQEDSSKHIALFLYTISKSSLSFLQKFTIFIKFQDLVVARLKTFNSDDRGQLIFAFSRIITQRSSEILHSIINSTSFSEKNPEEILFILDSFQFSGMENDYEVLEKIEKFYYKYHPFMERVEYVKVAHAFAKRDFGSEKLWKILQDCFFWFDYDAKTLGVIFSSLVRTNRTSDDFLRHVWLFSEKNFEQLHEKHKESIVYHLKRRNLLEGIKGFEKYENLVEKIPENEGLEEFEE